MDKFDLIVIVTGAGAHVVYLMNTEYQDLMSVIPIPDPPEKSSFFMGSEPLP